MNTNNYNNKALSHLQQPYIYQQVDRDYTEDSRQDISFMLLYYYHKGYFDYKTLQYLKPSIPSRTPLFYFLPKIHKTNNPPRPIISGCDSPTDRLSAYVTHFITPLASKLPSSIKDTKDFLRKIQDVPPLPHGSLLVTADVSSLYTNIPHDEGIAATMDAIRSNRHTMPDYTPPECVFRTFLHLILQNNYFQFIHYFYLQIFGTAMGTKMAPPYANLFMGKFEQDLLHNYPLSVLLWLRFIDDIFLIWTHGTTELQNFIAHVDSLHPTIRLEFHYSLTHVPYLDTIIYLDISRRLQSTIYRKPTDKHMLLHYTSYHPLHVKKSIIYTQALRYCTIISDESNLHRELITLKKIFIARGYPIDLINTYFDKALNFDRNDLLHRDNRPTPHKILPYIAPHHPSTDLTSQYIHDKWQQVANDPILSTLWPTPPITARTKHLSIRDLLIHTSQHPPTTNQPLQS